MKEWELVKETWLHRVNPSLKLGMSLLLCIAVMFVRNLEGHGGNRHRAFGPVPVVYGTAVEADLVAVDSFLRHFRIDSFRHDHVRERRNALVRMGADPHHRGKFFAGHADWPARIGLRCFGLDLRIDDAAGQLVLFVDATAALGSEICLQLHGCAAVDPDHDGRV